MDKYLKRKKIFVNPNKPLAESPPPPRDEMSTSTKKVKQEELEVTGVSRSGRVRKKSSKLTDFESPDEIDPRYKRKADRSTLAESATTPEPAHSTPKQRKSTPAPRKPQPPPPVEESHSMEEEASDEEEDEYNHGMKMDSDSDSETNMMYPIHSEEILDDEQSSDDDDDDGGTAVSDEEDEDDEDEGQLVMVDEGPKPSRPPNQAMSLYMLEKSTKKRLVVKDGKIVGRKKAQRKDKGKSRFTAYMLWAKEARKDILRTNPDMDFSTTSKRLGELWGIVPNSEKFTWRRRAKRMSVKQKFEEGKTSGGAAGASAQRKFLNKTSPPAAPAAPKLASPPRQEWRRQDRRNSNQGQLSTLAAAAAVAQQQQQMQLLQQQQLQNALAAAASDVSRPGLKPTTTEAQQAGMFKSVGTAPVDVASHLKLLGESLLIIGERLKEHEGQIAVSGSFSVLLDSLLCAMAPLICLTQQVPELNGCPAETLSQTLDNIAYIMPGL